MPNKLIKYILFLISAFNLLPLFAQTVIPSGSQLNMRNGAIIQRNDLVNNGIIDLSGGTWILTGSTADITGNEGVQFNNLTISAGTATMMSSPANSLKGELLCNGNLSANNNLILLSSALSTAFISGAGTGEITGTLTMQRYIESAFGYTYLSSPFQAATVNELSDDVDLTADFPTLYRYAEDNTLSGWKDYTATTGILEPLTGYAANFGITVDEHTADISGIVNNGDLALSLYNHDRPYTAGFCLAGNPYPSPIDWDAVGWTKTNIDNALYFFQASDTNQYTGIYSSYVNGISGDGVAGPVIPAMQGFFVHVSDGTYPVTALLGVSNEVRNQDTNPYYFKSTVTKQNPVLKMTASFDHGKADPAIFYFEESFVKAFEKNTDALKMMNTDIGVPSLYSITPEARRLSISALPIPGDDGYRVPLGINTEASGWINLHAEFRQGPSGEVHAFLLDAGTGAFQDLSVAPDFRFFNQPGRLESRFYLVFSAGNQPGLPDNLSDELFTIYYSGKEITISINMSENETATLQICNIPGQVVWQNSVRGNESLNMGETLPSGVYIVTLNGRAGTKSEKILLP